MTDMATIWIERQLDQPEDDIATVFAHNLRVRSALNRSKFKSLAELQFFKVADLMDIRNVGRKGVDDIVATMAEAGYTLLGDDENRAMTLIDAYGDARNVPVRLALHYKQTELSVVFFANMSIWTLGDLVDLSLPDFILRLREAHKSRLNLRFVQDELAQYQLEFKKEMFT